jgi:PKD-like domain
MTSGFISSLILLICDGNLLAPINSVGVSCPRVTVICAREHCYRSPYLFKAQISDGEQNQKVSYQWTITFGRGQIVKGQGTSTIEVVADNSNNITATVEVQGLPAECGPAIASISIINEPAPPAQQIDEFGAFPLDKLKPRFDQLANQLRNQPGARGYILSSGKWALSRSAQKYLSRTHNLKAGRIVYLQTETKRLITIKLFIVPANANPPVP